MNFDLNTLGTVGALAAFVLYTAWQNRAALAKLLPTSSPTPAPAPVTEDHRRHLLGCVLEIQDGLPHGDTEGQAACDALLLRVSKRPQPIPVAKVVPLED